MPEPTSVLDSRLRGLTLGLPLVVTLFAFDNLGVTTVMPRVARDLDGIRLYGWVFSAFTLASVVGLVAAGRHADRRGPAPGLTAGLALFVVGLIVTATAPNMGVVIAGRALQGLGSGSFGTTMYVVVGRAYPPGLRPRMFAVLSSAWVLPSLVGPALAGFLADTVGWRAVFAGLAALAPLPLTMTLPRLRRLVAPAADPGAALAADLPVAPAADPAARSALSSHGPPGPASPVLLGLGVAAGTAVLLGGLVASEWAAFAGLVVAGAAIAGPCLKRVLPPGTGTGRPGIPAAVALRGVLNIAFFGSDAFIPLLLVRVHHYSASVAGLPLTAGALTWTAASWASGRLRARVGAAATTAGALVLCAVGISGLIQSVHYQGALSLGIVSWAVAGFGMGLAYNLVSLTVVDLSPPGQEGVTAAALQVTDALGVALGTGIGGALVALGSRTTWGLANPLRVQFSLNAALALAAVVLALRLDARRVGGASGRRGPDRQPISRVP